MGVKEEISNAHTARLKDLHGHKQLREGRRTAIVVGSDTKTNIGHHIAQELRHYGCVVFEPTLRELDVTKEWMCESYCQEHRDADILILSHGFSRMDWIEEAKPIGGVTETVSVNLTGTHHMMQSFVNATLYQSYAKHIVVIGSMAYNNVLNASAIYCASKAGVAMLVRCAAWELAPKGYTVMALHPSNVQGTPMTEATIEGIMRTRNVDRATAEAYWGAVCPKDAFLTPEEIARNVAYCVSGSADYLSGANIELRGGQR